MSPLFIYLSLSATALCLGLMVYWLSMPGIKEDVEKPQQLEIHRAWGPVWPWITLFANLAKPFMSWRYRLAVEKAIIRAGRLDSLAPEHVLGMQIGSAMFGAVVAYFLAVSLDFSQLIAVILSFCNALLFFYLPRYHLVQQGKLRQKQILKQFPFFLDMITLSVEGGLNFHGALSQTHHLLPKGPLKMEINHVLSDIRAGLSRNDALKALAQRTDLEELTHLVSSIAQSQRLGVSLGPILRAQSEQRRSERFMRAEKLALEAPVKMLFPLVTCIFPCTFLVIAFPIGLKLMEAAW
ncbi:hypothetical protein HMPREF3144_09730 [Oligella sp. HMSC05A10]|uniref:type II secretion system F family protein n=1 Tax=Oligella TaxID=90243 RepID=UPI0008A3DADF|nr:MULTISPECIES: type II secretion system F family protein [Oligella]OFS82988.1 hypothetical protein HMPREF3144_09730 [Oligella sp. HMSC05A10]PMC16701.1 type II secretion system F family protein [Oligella urethralis]SUA60984.1 Flp pilus assembly protein TadB [Oligella urethralis]